MPGKTDVRGAWPDDYAAFAELFGELGVDEPPVPYERFCGEMLVHTVIAERDDRIVGYAFYRPAKDCVHLSNLVTAPHARRLGVGRTLMAEVVRRSKGAGCLAMTLNVMTSNMAAIRLYERAGLTAIRRNRHLKLEWATFDALDATASPFIDEVRDLEPGDDEAFEREHDLPAGFLRIKRARPEHVLRALRMSSLCAYDPSTGIVMAMRAPDLPQALSLLRGIRPFAQGQHVLIPIEGRPELADAFVAVGAVQRFETLFMHGKLPP